MNTETRYYKPANDKEFRRFQEKYCLSCRYFKKTKLIPDLHCSKDLDLKAEWNEEIKEWIYKDGYPFCTARKEKIKRVRKLKKDKRQLKLF